MRKYIIIASLIIAIGIVVTAFIIHRGDKADQQPIQSFQRPAGLPPLVEVVLPPSMAIPANFDQLSILKQTEILRVRAYTRDKLIREQLEQGVIEDIDITTSELYQADFAGSDESVNINLDAIPAGYELPEDFYELSSEEQQQILRILEIARLREQAR